MDLSWRWHRLLVVGGCLVGFWTLGPGCTGTGEEEIDSPTPDGDDDIVSPTPTPAAGTIMALNQNPPADNTVVTVEGIVTGISYKGNFWISDPSGGLWSGIYVYDEYVKRGTTTVGIGIGDRISVTAPFKVYYGVRELVIYEDSGTIEMVQDNQGLPPAVTLTDLEPLRVNDLCDADTSTALEPYMGTYLQLPETTVSAGAGACGTDAQYGLWETSDSAGNKVLVDDDTDPDYEPFLGDRIRMAGVLFFTDFNDLGNYKFLPTAVEVVESNQPTPDPDLTLTELNQDPPAENSVVELTGLVTGLSTDGDFWIMDSAGGPWSGLYIYDEVNKKGQAAGIVVGDEVTVRGVYKLFYGQRQLQIYEEEDKGSVTVISSGNALPVYDLTELSVFNASDLCASGNFDAAEPYVSMLVRVAEAKVSAAKGVCDAVSDKGVWTVEDASGDDVLVDDIFGYDYVPAIGDDLSVTGLVSFSFDKYKILPRSDADLVSLD